MKKRIDTDSSQADAPSADATLFHRHLQLGWFTLLVFLSLGALLEALHGFKVDAYLNVAHETRRLMWTLAHAHGALFGVLHLAFAFTLRAIGAEASLRKASLCLIGATVLLPGGFLLGGAVTYGGDPGRGILLVPVGAVLLFVAVLLTALQARKRG